jgi:hypothetical protein
MVVRRATAAMLLWQRTSCDCSMTKDRPIYYETECCMFMRNETRRGYMRLWIYMKTY